MESNNLFCLKWSNFQKNVSNEFKKIQMDEDLVDITFVCGEGGESFGAHKLVLFACSPFLKRLLKVSGNSPIKIKEMVQWGEFFFRFF